MQRYAFVMRLKKGCEQEYKRRHDAIWPELKELLSRSGVRDYSIFLHEETGMLFAVQKLEGMSSSQSQGADPVVQKWWAYMADIMETNPDKSPTSEPLSEVFHLD
jgi:L-rhamnose mutarotase